MKQIPAGTFKARCLAVMKDVQTTGEPVTITKRGKPLVRLVPVEKETTGLLGSMQGKVKIIGDIESPIPVEWTVTRE